jgi:hypothetical protein
VITLTDLQPNTQHATHSIIHYCVIHTSCNPSNLLTMNSFATNSPLLNAANDDALSFGLLASPLSSSVDIDLPPMPVSPMMLPLTWSDVGLDGAVDTPGDAVTSPVSMFSSETWLSDPTVTDSTSMSTGIDLIDPFRLIGDDAVSAAGAMDCEFDRRVVGVDQSIYHGSTVHTSTHGYPHPPSPAVDGGAVSAGKRQSIRRVRGGVRESRECSEQRSCCCARKPDRACREKRGQCSEWNQRQQQQRAA